MTKMEYGEKVTQKFLIVERSWGVEDDSVVGIILVCEPIEEHIK